MQDCYTGDIGDYAKYGLLRKLSAGKTLGVAWYLFPDEEHKSDGDLIGYLEKPRLWRSHDPDLYDTLKGIVTDGQRTVSEVERRGVLGDAQFSSEMLSITNLPVADLREWRSKWFERVLTTLEHCDLVFADPDNGLCEHDRFRPGRVADWKRLPLSEAKALGSDRTAVIYHHNTRRKGGHREEVSYWIEKLGAGTRALRWRAFGARTFFIVNPTPGMLDILEAFAHEWGPKAELHHR